MDMLVKASMYNLRVFWLFCISESGFRCFSLIFIITGIPKEELPVLSSSPYEADFKIHAAEVLNKPETNIPEIRDDKADVISDLSTNNTFVTASESSLFEDNEQTLTSESEEQSDDEQSEGTFLNSKLIVGTM